MRLQGKCLAGRERYHLMKSLLQYALGFITGFLLADMMGSPLATYLSGF